MERQRILSRREDIDMLEKIRDRLGAYKPSAQATAAMLKNFVEVVGDERK